METMHGMGSLKNATSSIATRSCRRKAGCRNAAQRATQREPFARMTPALTAAVPRSVERKSARKYDTNENRNGIVQR